MKIFKRLILTLILMIAIMIFKVVLTMLIKVSIRFDLVIDSSNKAWIILSVVVAIIFRAIFVRKGSTQEETEVA